VLTCVKQLIAMEAGLRFILANYNDPKRPESSQVRVLLSKNRQQIRRLRGVTEQLVKKSEQVRNAGGRDGLTNCLSVSVGLDGQTCR
jgi:hypothetical protein